MNIALLAWILLAGQVITHIILIGFFVRTGASTKKKQPREEPAGLQAQAKINSLAEDLKAANTGLQQLKTENAQYKEKLSGKDQELEKILAQNLKQDKEREEQLQEKNARIEVLENEALQLSILKDENKVMAAELKNLEARIEALKKEQASPARGETVKVETHPSERIKARKNKKIGEILLEYGFITRDILDKALAFQEKTNCSISQYLLSNGYISESQLAQCLCTQFSIPYLPLGCYAISEKIIEMVPAEVAQKHWLIPVEKLGNLLSVVMVDPLDANAIKEVEEITRCQVQPFVGILSEIIEALTKYYKIPVKDREFKEERALPFFIDTETYKGPERRGALRYRAQINIHFAADGHYKETKTKDISQGGILFESDIPIAVGSYFTLQIDLPEDYSPLPIAAIAQVMRVIRLEEQKFGIGIKIIKISRQELNILLEYASSHEEK